ncbi:substrate-binding domain-containing protein [Paenibacillus glycanilyticus]|uniref:LacI family DNA-binding transcriptional regulator n=1 Tax=Paenibacillus glycanilyticus TaxID=126569 RepID=UPI0020414E8B|nr:substrate-binding domain-containing protein [Paenibacillus glycanilyticus]MCM3627022.1 substrate-binding domain-containing protein [Paenibacillus glycanilyticus]
MVTLSEIAKKANVSVTTVSRVVNYNDTSVCSEEMQKLIWSLVDSMGYKVKKRVNNKQEQKKPDRTFTIAYVLGTASYVMQQSYSYAIIKGIESEAIRRGADITFTCLNLDLYTPEMLGEKLVAASVEAVIWVAGTSEAYFEVMERLGIKITIAGIEPGYYPEDVDYVGIDFYAETLRWMKTRFVNQFERVGYIGPKELSRYQAFVDAHGILDKPVQEEYILELEGWTIEEAKTVMQDYMTREGKLPEAIFAACDSIALGAMTVLKSQGIQIPDQVRVLGFDNIEMASYFVPELTTIEVPTYKIGVMAVQAALSRLRGERDFAVRYLFPTQYIERQSL